MNNFFNKALMVASMLSVVAASTVKADEFSGGQDNASVNAYLDQQATDSQLSDPTARDSIRSHGRP